MRKSPLLRFFTYSASFLSVVHAFSVTVGNPTQCDDLAVSWTGGQAPFEILLTPIAGPLHNYSVPASAFSNGKGSYSIPELPITNGTEIMLTMSDATGFASGGTTIILTVGAPIGNNNCNAGPGVPDFYFSTPLQLQQCAEYEFTSFGSAVLPATITALIPGGEHISFYVTGPTYTWAAVDVQAGTNLVFFMIDSEGRQGGVSPLDQVLPLSNSSCLNVNSPSSTMSAAPSQTSSQSTPSQTQSGNNTTNAGVIAGAAVGGVVFLVLLIVVGVYCIRKKSRQSRHNDDGHEVKKNLPAQYQTKHDIPLPMQPGSQSHLPASDPFNQHLRQVSYTDSFAGSSSVSSVSRLMGGQTASSTIFPHQTLPVGLAQPTHPGTYSHLTNASVGNFAVDGPHSQFSPVPSSRLSSNPSSIAGYGQMTAMDGQTASQVHSFPSPTLSSHYRNSLAVSDPSSPLPTARLSSNMEGSGSASHVGAGRSSMASSGAQMSAAVGQATTSPSAHIIMHTDIEDVPTSSNTPDVIELPPQYTDRVPHSSQPASAPNQKSSFVLSPPDSIMHV